MEDKSESYTSYDYLLLIPTLVLMGLGLVEVYSASSFVAEHKLGDSYYYLKRQAVFCLLGLGVMITAKNIPAALYMRLVYPLLFLSLVSLGLVFVPGLGMKAGGATRWLRVGGFSFQPAEFAKLSLALYVAYSLAKKGPHMAVFSKGFIPHLLIGGLFILPIMFQPDMGTAIIIWCWLMVLLFVGGVRITHLLSLVLLCVPVLVWLVFRADYRWKRWLAFLNPWDDPQGLGYHIIHSFLAIGSGGISGVGLGNSKQKLLYLPEPHTDFILSIVAEELGLVGVAVVIILFSVLVMRGIQVALEASDMYSSYLALGISCLMGLQVVINMAVVMGLLPTKGLTLPLMSYGGSSLVISLFGIGVLLGISARRQRN